jgi:hypothetical protein
VILPATAEIRRYFIAGGGLGMTGRCDVRHERPVEQAEPGGPSASSDRSSRPASGRSAGRSRRRSRSPYVTTAASSDVSLLVGIGRPSSHSITSPRSNRSLSPPTGAGKSACRLRHRVTAALVAPASPAICAWETVGTSHTRQVNPMSGVYDLLRASP